jgi:hypothetical protein
MAGRVYTFAVTVPAGTLQASPQVTALTIAPGRVTALQVHMLPGHNGAVGYALGYAGTQYYPFNSGGWETIESGNRDYSPSDDMDAGSWSLVAYNTGAYDHTLTVRIETEPLAAALADLAVVPLVAIGEQSTEGALRQPLEAPRPYGPAPAPPAVSATAAKTKARKTTGQPAGGAVVRPAPPPGTGGDESARLASNLVSAIPDAPPGSAVEEDA